LLLRLRRALGHGGAGRAGCGSRLRLSHSGRHRRLEESGRAARALTRRYGKSRLPVLIDGLNGSSIFLLTPVTRIFQKKIFTETTPETTPAPGRHAAPGFLLREPRVRPRAAGFSCLQKKQENTEEIKAMPFQKGQSGNPAGRPRGIVNRATALAQNLLSERAEGIARKVIELAEEGDMAAIRLPLGGGRVLTISKTLASS